MRIKSINIHNFKSLIHFGIDLEKFNCIVGLNGSGKSTFLQAVDFLAQLVRGDMKKWFEDRHWQCGDIKFKLEEKQNRRLVFVVTFGADDGTEIVWEGHYSGITKCCTYEVVTMEDTYSSKKKLLSVFRKRYTMNAPTSEKTFRGQIEFNYTGSVMSQLSDKMLGQCPLLIEIRDFMRNIKSLDLISPDTLKSASRAVGDIGLGGERFPSFIKTLTAVQRAEILKDMQKFYPKLCTFNVTGQRGGVKKVTFEEDCEDKGRITFDARHINDGLIRILAIIAQTQVKRSLILFDEIENGINPELMEALVNYLINCNSQVIVTTHNPMILNYIPDEVACKSIDFFYKKDGETKTKKFYDLPEIQEKSAYLAPGEIFVDTNLTELSNRLASEKEAEA